MRRRFSALSGFAGIDDPQIRPDATAGLAEIHIEQPHHAIQPVSIFRVTLPASKAAFVIRVFEDNEAVCPLTFRAWLASPDSGKYGIRKAAYVPIDFQPATSCSCLNGLALSRLFF
jgi:hypothetical protein